MSKLEVTVTAANFKRIDLKAYGVVTKEAWVKLTLGEQEKSTTRVACPTLDPIFEQSFVFEGVDPENQKLTATFFLGDHQIGQPTDYILNSLTKGKLTYKGMPVIGGKVDLMLRAIDFGKEEEKKEEEEGGDFFDYLS